MLVDESAQKRFTFLPQTTNIITVILQTLILSVPARSRQREQIQI